MEGEIRRLKEFELSKIRMDEAQKYRQKLQDYRDEIERLQQDKIRELKVRENEALERIKNKERDLDKQAFEYRQKQLRDEEVLKAREGEVRKTMELDLQMLRNEKDMLAKTMRDYEHRVKDMEVLRIRIEKEKIEDVERTKSEM